MIVERMRGGLVVWIVLVQVRMEPVSFVDSDRLDEAWKEGKGELVMSFLFKVFPFRTSCSDDGTLLVGPFS
jgi:hypothetical protein